MRADRFGRSRDCSPTPSQADGCLAVSGWRPGCHAVQQTRSGLEAPTPSGLSCANASCPRKLSSAPCFGIITEPSLAVVLPTDLESG
jgi:hypothetical protein